MNKIKGKDWLILALDIIAVNAAYFLALPFVNCILLLLSLVISPLLLLNKTSWSCGAAKDVLFNACIIYVLLLLLR